MTETELREHHKALLEAEQGLAQIRAHVFSAMALLTEQTEQPTAAKLAFHADAELCSAFDSLRILRRELHYQIEKLPEADEEPDEHENGVPA